MSQAVKITDNRVAEFEGIENMLLVVADPITGRLYRKTLVKLVTLNADGAVIIPADSILEKIIIIPEGDMLLKIGTAEGGEDILPETAVDLNGYLVSLNMYVKDQKQIFFTGIAPNTLLKFITF